MSEVFFSIIIPVYNTESTLSRSLDSVLSQNFPSDSFKYNLPNLKMKFSFYQIHARG